MEKLAGKILILYNLRRKENAAVAQLVEHFTRNKGVHGFDSHQRLNKKLSEVLQTSESFLLQIIKNVIEHFFANIKHRAIFRDGFFGHPFR